MKKLDEYNSGKMATRVEAEEYIKTHSPHEPIPEEIMNFILSIMRQKTEEMDAILNRNIPEIKSNT